MTVFAAYVVVTALTAAANLGIAVADMSRAGFVLANTDEVGVSRSWLPLLAALKGAGATGLLVGLVGVSSHLHVLRYLGVAAAAGLVVFFAGALATHVRAGVLHNIAFPFAYWLLAIGSLALLIAVG